MVMKCPSCEDGSLVEGQLENRLYCSTCTQCGGNWLFLTDYLHWKEIKSDDSATESDVQADVVAEETKHALVCPVSGALMLKYRISGHTNHRLDLSPSANGVWLDKGEWALLKKEGLADKLNSIFTDPWQRQIRSDSTRNTLTAVYTRQFGEADYAKIKDIRQWINEHPKKAYLQAYLLADNPYKA